MSQSMVLCLVSFCHKTDNVLSSDCSVRLKSGLKMYNRGTANPQRHILLARKKSLGGVIIVSHWHLGMFINSA